MDFSAMLAKMFNPSGPMDLSTGQTAAPTGMDMAKGIGQGAQKGFGIGNIIVDAIGGMPTYTAPPQKKAGGDLESLLAQLKGGQQPQQSPMEQLLQRLFGMKPTNPVAPNMGPMGGGTQIPTGGPQGGTGGLY